MKTIFPILILNTLFFYGCNTNHKNNDLYEKELKTYQSLIDLILLTKLEETKIEGYFIHDTVAFLQDGSQLIVNISQIKDRDSDALFFIYSDKSCNSCVQEALNQIGKILKFNSINVYIISNFTAREVIIFKEMHKWDYNKVHLLSGLDSFVKKIGKFPTFFTVNSNNEVDKVFIHDKTYSHITLEYLQLMSNWAK